MPSLPLTSQDSVPRLLLVAKESTDWAPLTVRRKGLEWRRPSVLGPQHLTVFQVSEERRCEETGSALWSGSESGGRGIYLPEWLKCSQMRLPGCRTSGSVSCKSHDLDPQAHPEGCCHSVLHHRCCYFCPSKDATTGRQRGHSLGSYSDPCSGLGRNSFNGIVLQSFLPNPWPLRAGWTSPCAHGERDLGQRLCVWPQSLSFPLWCPYLNDTLHLTSSPFNPSPEPCMKLFPVHPALAFFAHCLFPGD